MKAENAGALYAPKDHSRTTEDLLIQSHGVLLNLQQCAALLNRTSAESLRVAISSNTELARLLAPEDQRSAAVCFSKQACWRASSMTLLRCGDEWDDSEPLTTPSFGAHCASRIEPKKIKPQCCIC
ncbi:MAG: hypothetical protein ACJ8LG_17010 [Massilia sp.]